MFFSLNTIENFALKHSVKKNNLSFEEFLKVVSPEWDFYDKQSEMVEFASLKGVKLVLATRGFGKTDILVIFNTLYRIYCNPAQTFLIICEKMERSRALLRAMAGVIAQNESLFTGWICKQDTIHTPQNSTNKNASIQALAITTSLRGSHPDSIIMDDPISHYTKGLAMHEMAKNTYTECLKLFLKKDYDLLVIGNPVKKDDLYQTMLKSQEVNVFSLWNDDLPIRWQKDIEEIRALGVPEHEIQANYFGNIIARTSSFSDISTTPLSTFKFEGATMAFIDPSFEGEDLTGVTLIDENANAKVFALDGNFHHKKIQKELENIFRSHNVHEIFIESNNESGAFIALNNKYSNVYPFKSTENKEKRIASYISLLKPYLKVARCSIFTEHVSNFEFGNKDDVIDSLAMACYTYVNYSIFKDKCQILKERILDE